MKIFLITWLLTIFILEPSHATYGYARVMAGSGVIDEQLFDEGDRKTIRRLNANNVQKRAEWVDDCWQYFSYFFSFLR